MNKNLNIRRSENADIMLALFTAVKDIIPIKSYYHPISPLTLKINYDTMCYMSENTTLSFDKYKKSIWNSDGRLMYINGLYAKRVKYPIIQALKNYFKMKFQNKK